MWTHDVRLAVRSLRKTPLFTLVALVTLTLAIGANTAIFSLLNALMLRDLPVRDPHSLVELSSIAPGSTYEAGLNFSMYRDLQVRRDLFSAVIGWWPISVISIETDRQRGRGAAMYASANFFTELGAQPVAGRFPTADEVAEATWSPARVAVIGSGFWRRRFGGDPSAIGRTIQLEGEPFTIVGVAPPGFRGMVFEIEPDVVLPLTAIPVVERREVDQMRRESMFVRVTARLAPGVTLDRARAALDAWWPAIKSATVSARQTPAQRDQFFATRLSVASAARGVEPGRETWTRPLVIVFGIAALILAIACANLASLMVARAASRTREIGVQLALGAGRWRVVRPLMLEALLVSFAGAICGLGFAYWTGSAAVAALFRDYTVPAGLDVAPDLRLVVFAGTVALVVALVCSGAPAWLLSRVESTTLLQQDARTMSTTRGTGRALIAVQIALSLTLLTNAGLLVRSLAQIRAVDSGMRANQVYVAYPMPRPRGYDGLDNEAYYPALADTLARISGVQSLTLSLFKPAGGGINPMRAGRSDVNDSGADIPAVYIATSPGLFETLGVPLREGRDFNWQDNSHARPVAVVSEAFARRLWPSGGAVGRRIRIGTQPGQQAVEVVGVAANAHVYDLKDPNLAAIYVPALQQPNSNWKCIVVRGSAATVEEVRRAVASFGHEDVDKVESLSYITDRALLRERGTAMLAAFFGLLALVLVAIGLYGLMSYGVQQRRREIGIRMALGAQPSRVIGSIVADSLAVTACGVAGGFVAALLTAPLVKSFLFGITLHDPVTLAAAPVLLAVVTIAAALIPANRAARTDPMEALRSE